MTSPIDLSRIREGSGFRPESPCADAQERSPLAQHSNRGAFVRELLDSSVVRLSDRRQPERYDLRCWSGGYAIYDRGELICTFHGPQFDLASKVLRRLRDEALAGAAL